MSHLLCFLKISKCTGSGPVIGVLFFLGSALARELVALFSPTVMLQAGVPSDAGGTEGDFSLGAIHLLGKQSFYQPQHFYEFFEQFLCSACTKNFKL